MEGGRVPVGAGAATAGYTSAETALWKRLASAVSGVNVVFCGSRSILDEQVCVCFVGSCTQSIVRPWYKDVSDVSDANCDDVCQSFVALPILLLALRYL